MPDSLSKPFFVTLGLRGRVRLSGADRVSFLQNLASNDIRRLERQPVLYSCFLSPQGKFLHDFFVRAEGDSLLLECEGGGRAEALLKHMKPFKLRSKVEMTVEADVTLYAVFSSTEKLDDEGYFDPRGVFLGYRTTICPSGMDEKPFSVWDITRIRHAVPDGSRDMEIGRDTLLECNIDKVDGVSLDKGCYVGQEITARMHLRGLVKKHLRPVGLRNIESAVPFTDIFIDGQLVGQMRSSCGDLGLVLLKEESLLLIAKDSSPLSLLEERVQYAN